MVKCTVCGQLAEQRQCLGINGGWICPHCMSDQGKYDEFRKARFALVNRLVEMWNDTQRTR